MVWFGPDFHIFCLPKAQETVVSGFEIAFFKCVVQYFFCKYGINSTSQGLIVDMQVHLNYVSNGCITGVWVELIYLKGWTDYFSWSGASCVKWEFCDKKYRKSGFF